MNKMGKALFLILVMILASSSLLMVESTYFQSTTKPSTPEFTLAFTKQNENYTVIEVVIKNQIYTTAEIDRIRTGIRLFYNIQIKEYESDQWTSISYEDLVGWLEQSSSDITIYHYVKNSTLISPKIDFRVQAMNGTFYFLLTGERPSGYSPIFTGETSDWSESQSIIIPEIAEISPSPTVPECSFVVILSFLVIMTMLIVVVKSKCPKAYN